MTATVGFGELGVFGLGEVGVFGFLMEVEVEGFVIFEVD